LLVFNNRTYYRGTAQAIKSGKNHAFTPRREHTPAR
jgi:hypothetical protein